jgi:endonuclease V-like protein UPF0215 family
LLQFPPVETLLKNIKDFNVHKMKKQPRILGIDDAPFTFNQKYTIVIGVVMRGGEYLEAVLRSEVEIDGTNATLICKEMVQNSKHRQQLRAIMLDGVAFGGFNILDIQQLYQQTNTPIITVTRDHPDFDKIKHALQQNFLDWGPRWKTLQQGKLYTVSTHHNPIYVKCAGIPIQEAEELIKLSTIRGVIPEPIRVAHLIASGIIRGESYGKA